MPAQEHDACRRPSVRRRGGQRHRVRLRSGARAHRPATPRAGRSDRRRGRARPCGDRMFHRPRRTDRLPRVAATRVIEIRTEIPGPRSREILERERRAVARPLIVHEPIVADRARGRRSPTSTATRSSTSSAAWVSRTSDTTIRASSRRSPSRSTGSCTPISRSCRTRATSSLPSGSARSFRSRGETRGAFFNAGAEAVENAVKLARLYTKRQGVIAFEGAFHGRTWLALTMTSKTHPYKTGLGPFAPEVYRAPYPNAYRGPDATTALAALERLFTTHVSPDHVAAIVFEPQQGEGGFLPAPAEFVDGPAADLRRARDRPRRGRGADRVRPHGPDVRHGALRRRARPADRREVDRRRPAALGRARSGGDHGRPALGRDRRDVHRQPRRARGRVCGARRRSRRSSSSPAPAPRRRDPRAHARLAGALAPDRRRARARSDARDRARPRSRRRRSPRPSSSRR